MTAERFLSNYRAWIELFIPVIQVVIGSIIATVGTVIGVRYMVKKEKSIAVARKSVDFFERNLTFYNTLFVSLNDIIEKKKLSLKDRNDLLDLFNLHKDKMFYCDENLQKRLKKLMILFHSFRQEENIRQSKRVMKSIRRISKRLSIILRPFIFNLK